MECAPHPNTTLSSGRRSETDHAHDNQPEESKNRHLYNQRTASLKSSSAALLSLGGKLRDDVVFAKREIAFGHFQSKHISEMHRLFMNILVPIMGFSTITDISERLNHGFCTDTEWLEVLDSPEFAHTQDSEEERGSESIEWSELIQPLHASLKSLWKLLTIVYCTL